MALYITADRHIDDNERHLIRFYDKYQVQHYFCRELEVEVDFELEQEKLFLTDPAVTEYLAGFGITYKGNYIIESEHWPVNRQFVTYLNYPLQMACVALHIHQDGENYAVVIENTSLYYFEYLLPVLKQMDVYLLVTDYGEVYESSGIIQCEDVINNGIELVIAGKSCNEMDSWELSKFLRELYDESRYLTKERDAKVFPADFKEQFILEPAEMSLEEYVQANDEDFPEKNDWLPDEGTRFSEARIKVNGRNLYNGAWRRYPIHYLFHMDGVWKYESTISVKYPSLAELLNDALNVDSISDIDVSAATEIFALVLDCNEVCDISHYWEHTAFVAKYDKESNVIEICDLYKGILEFHELLQGSEALRPH